MLRELREETGIVLEAPYREPLYCAACPGKGPEDTYWVTTYLWTGAPVHKALVLPEEGLEVRWLCDEALQGQRRSPFANYNCGVFSAPKAYQG